MRVVVAGGSGQLGTALVRRLAADRAVSEIVSVDAEPPAVVSTKLRAVSSDAQGEALARALEGADALVHLGSGNVIAHATAAGVKHLVHVAQGAPAGARGGATQQHPRLTVTGIRTALLVGPHMEGAFGR